MTCPACGGKPETAVFYDSGILAGSVCACGALYVPRAHKETQR